jgi:hypothetical protein
MRIVFLLPLYPLGGDPWEGADRDFRSGREATVVDSSKA